MFEFKLPDVGEGMHEAEIVRWLVNPGETVKLDQIMLEIQTDKALVEIPSPVAGVVGQILKPIGQIAHVGDVLINFETQASAKSSTIAPMVATVPVVAAVSAIGTFTPAESGVLASRVRAAPAVRKRALELGVNLALVKASSPDGRVLLQDVLAYAEESKHKPTTNGASHAPILETVAPPPPVVSTTPIASGGEERKPLVGLQRRMAERMELAWRTIPHVTTFEQVDSEQLIEMRRQIQPAAEQRGVSLTYLPFIVKAVVAALKANPIFNSSLDEKTREVIYKRYYHIGLATATPDGLVVAVVRDADKLSLSQLGAEIARLAEGGRNRSLKPHELSGSTFTISNYGSYDGGMGTPIINPPEVAILGVGRIKDEVVARNGLPIVRPMLPLNLSFDHRLIDGATSGQFMRVLMELLENPARLMLDMV
ncbi:MAG: 2-oxo acid dehydrogenase subunit E2 [Chloroflexi bacterium]|uniref:Dihydrolipoamide acetyltransferase component of pyruvate dehydrogenase complex n=1 Tax=Candidatus Chlorohelix allophototropha TaxID=3003348 RepID=A0A8T7LYC6_9CHLR|nr:2-oxo acid dehydrogenase subunit E2 [Chloroflexota bacterium]WJW67788.1 2-oxo acid dehydrogenase subunit E2 [Chloroflexota bacterium L227-S17]